MAMEELTERIRLAIKALNTGDPAAKCKAAQTLGSIGAAAADAVPALIRALDDRGEYVTREWWDHPWGNPWKQVEYVRNEAVNALFLIQPAEMPKARATMISLLECHVKFTFEIESPYETFVSFSDDEWTAAGGKP